MKKTLIFILLLLSCLFLAPRSYAIDDIDFEELFDNHQSVMLIIHPITGDIYYANQAAADFYGYDIETLLSMTIDQINTLTPEEVAKERLKALEEERNFFIFKHRLSNGDEKTVYVYSYPVEINGETYLYSIVIDQTAFVLAEDRNRLLIIFGITVLMLSAIVTAYLALKISAKKREIEKSNRILYESEQRFNILHNASFGGLAIHDQGMILDCNQGLSDISGYSIDELVGANGLRLIAPDHRDYVTTQIRSGYEKPYETFGIRKSGDIYPLRLEARNLPYHGKQVRVVEFRDITELKRQEEATMALENQWSKLIQEMPLGFNVRELIFDDEGHPIDYVFISVNINYESITGLKREDIIGRRATEIMPDIETSWIEHYAKVVQTKKTMAIEDYSRALGRYFKVVAYPYKNNQFVIVAEDITDRKTYEQQIKTKDREKSRIISNLPGVSYRCQFDESWTMLFLSETCEALTGYSPSELIGNKDISFNDLIVPTYWKMINDEWASARRLNQPCNIEYEIIKKDGTRIWVWEKGKCFFEDQAWYIEGFLMDVTERKLSEQRIDYASKHDYLTGLPNRRYFDETIRALDQSKNFPIIVSMIDIDGLKLINDTYGHQAGDNAIITLSNILTEVFKDQAFISRIGGDEFIVVFTQTDLEAYDLMLSRVMHLLSQVTIHDIPLSSSCGTAIKTDDSQDIDQILIDAENQMYSNKTLHNQSSKSQVIVALFESLKDKNQAERAHSDRVSQYCQMMGERLKLTKQEVLELEIAGRMHDIGKITIPDHILKKPGKLTDEEWVIMQNHTINGYQILRSADKYSNLAEYALTHHERWDGQGYPKGLEGEEIPLFSRIICISDAFEAMTSDRPYRKAMPLEDAVEELKRCAGTQFDPKLVDVFVRDVIREELLNQRLS